MFEEVTSIGRSTIGEDDHISPPATFPEQPDRLVWGFLPDREIAVVVDAEDEALLADRGDVEIVGAVGKTVAPSGLYGPFQVHADLFEANPYSDIDFIGSFDVLFFVYGRLPGDDREYNYVVLEDRLIEWITE